MLGERLRELRKSKKLTAKQLGEKFNLAESTISGYETGARKPDIELVRSFAKFFGVTTDYLLGVSNTPDLTEKDEKDIAKRMDKIKEDLKKAKDTDGLNFYGEPMSEEAIESLLEAIEYAERQTIRINKKYTPKKYRKNE
jgi:transcriptional regulator with XRE-family HTH domain